MVRLFVPFLIAIQGHGGHEVADLALSTLPGLVTNALDQASATSVGRLIPNDVSRILSEQIVAFDAKIASDIKDLFPSDLSAIENMHPNEISAIINDSDIEGSNHAKIVRGMRGSTALLALVDKWRENLWIANLGDCQAGGILYELHPFQNDLCWVFFLDSPGY